MMTLGDILGSAKRSATVFQRWIETAHPEFADEVRAAAVRSGDSLAGFVRMAVADFGRFADEEAWAQLTGKIRDAEDPGITCLLAIVRWRLSVDCCTNHPLLNSVEGRS